MGWACYLIVFDSTRRNDEAMNYQRDSTKDRGYGGRHRKTRAKYARELKRAGQVPCARCLLPVYQDWPLAPPMIHAPKCKAPACEGQCWTTWDAGHTDDRQGYNGIEHATCNRAAGGVNRRRMQTRKAPEASKDYGW